MVKFETGFRAAGAASTCWSRLGALDLRRLSLVALAVVAARTAAMAMNRIADRRFDAGNPRTRNREIVTGAVSLPTAWTLLAASAGAFVLAAFAISTLCGALAAPVLGVLLGYSYAKRFTWAAHLWLGVAQALGPIGVAVALTGRAPASAVLLGLGVGAWVAGFDVLYSLQDMEFDRGARLHSIPARFGVAGALAWSRLLHLAAAAAIVGAGLLAGRGPGWLAGSILLAAVLGAEHDYVAPGGRLRGAGSGPRSFNAFASVAFAACALADLALTFRP
jgi:4-hydroxybenzoate polyprenyltransferase